MLLTKKKDIFQELATMLFLMRELVLHPQASTYMPRLRERATTALDAALPYTGILGNKQIRAFLEAKTKKFDIECGTNIIPGDTIRFVEIVTDNRRKPPRILGKRGVTADVVDIHPPSDNPILLLRVITSGGVWDLQPGDDIRRTLKSIIHLGVTRCPWDDEDRRMALKNEAIAPSETITPDPQQQNIKNATPTTMRGRYDILQDR